MNSKFWLQTYMWTLREKLDPAVSILALKAWARAFKVELDALERKQGGEGV